MRFLGVRSAALLVLLSLLMGGCNTTAIYQDDRYNPPVYWGRHVVKPGETLYSIAWRYGRDYRELGSANGIRPPFHLQAGQVIRLDLRGSETASASPSTPPRSASVPRVSSTDSNATAASPQQPRTSSPSRQSTSTNSSVNWRWPHLGTVLATFSTSGKVNKGIDIAGNPGDSVKAAASGNVVYAGDGLLGYGNLVIVNHNEHYLSAYAHNQKILVKEGEDVTAGQTIAELGSSGTDRPKLHFEIRKNGNPVDPLRFLPRR